MAILEMSKIRLLGLEYQKNEILDCLHKSGCVELRDTAETENTSLANKSENKKDLQLIYSRVQNAIAFVSEICERRKKEIDKDLLLDDFAVSYKDFSLCYQRKKEYESIVLELETLKNLLSDYKTEKIRLNNLSSQISVYESVKERFCDFSGTEKTVCFLGTVKKENLEKIKVFAHDIKCAYLKVYKEDNLSVAAITVHKDFIDELEKILSETGFNKCPYYYDLSATEKLKSINDDIVKIEVLTEEAEKKVCSFLSRLKELKIFADNLKFKIEKENAAEKFRCTDKTFILDGFLPKEKEEYVKSALLDITGQAVFIEFSEPKKEERVPTLVKNNRLIRQTEFVTDMYSTPDYREIDPNRVTFFFFMLFMGVIMADIGYGVLMIIIGAFIAKRYKIDCGAKRLWNLVAVGGIFSIIFGILFNSFFGFGILPFSVLPNPAPDLETGAIDLQTIMTLLLSCLGLGVFQLATGYFCKALNDFKNGKVADGILDGLLWVLFFIGLVFASFTFLADYLNIVLSEPIENFFSKFEKMGIAVVISTVAIAAITAGRKEKGFGKFSKGFGAVYGLINIVSDILSYARLFGLMLSGMIIAQTFNYKLGLPIIQSGGVGIVLGGFIIFIGHAFNLAMNVLGAYIHDSRLQYIEFFSKFYTGEGDKFSPLGSDYDYIYLVRE